MAGFGLTWSAAPATWPFSASRPARATEPKPIPVVWPKKCRRVISSICSRIGSMARRSFRSTLRHDLVEVQNHVADHRPGGQLAWMKVGVELRLTRADQFPGRLCLPCVMSEEVMQGPVQFGKISNVWFSGGCQSEHVNQAIVGRRASLSKSPLGQGARRLHELRLVH